MYCCKFARSCVLAHPSDGHADRNELVWKTYWFGLWILSSIVCTCYNFAWDVLVDWKLFTNASSTGCDCVVREELVFQNVVGPLFYFIYLKLQTKTRIVFFSFDRFLVAKYLRVSHKTAELLNLRMLNSLDSI